MRIYIPDMDSFFQWMEENSYHYVVLRGFEGFLDRYPAKGGKEDVDLLVDDRAIAPIRDRFRKLGKLQGVKCDIYSVHQGHHADYLGHAYYPKSLAESLLRHRQRWRDRFFVPGAEDYYFSLAYHIAYHKAETSGIHYEPNRQARETKYHPVLRDLAKRLGIVHNFSLRTFHSQLTDKGYGLSRDCLISYLQNDFSRRRKSYFYAVLADEAPGEINLFVIRKVAVKTGYHGQLIETLAQRYQILMQKEIPWIVRLKNSRHMRGGKWKRGGKPYIALVVFDPEPVPSTAEDREIHPFVFNSNQFVKRDLREWFVSTAKVREKDNALHSTDNEAEAIGHLPLFFTKEEQFEILARVARLRGELPSSPHVLSRV